MAVQPQTPYKEYTANGSTKSFALEFDCYNQDHLIVLVDDVEEIVGTWSLSNGAVVFGSAPASGKKITIQRNTPSRRDGDFQSYDNSFRPGPVNKGFDWIWLKLQELGVADWILSTRINDLRAYVERQDSVLQENIDNLKTYVDDRDDELRSYLLEEIRKQGVALDQLDDYYNYLMQRLAQIAVDKGWDASFVVDAGGSTQQDINDFGGAKWRNKAGGYALGATVKLDNGDIVKSAIGGNTNDPNENPTFWYLDTSNFLKVLLKEGESFSEINYNILQVAANTRKNIEINAGSFYVSNPVQLSNGQIVTGQGADDFKQVGFTKLTNNNENGGVFWYTSDTSSGQKQMPQVYNCGLYADYPIRFNNEKTAVIVDGSGSNCPYGMRPYIRCCNIRPRVNGVGIGVSLTKQFDGIVEFNNIRNFAVNVLLFGCDLNTVRDNRILHAGRYNILELSALTFSSQNIITHNDILYIGNDGTYIKTTARHARIFDNYLEHADGVNRPKFFIDSSSADVPTDLVSASVNLSDFRFTTSIKLNRIDGMHYAKAAVYRYQPQGQTYGEIEDVGTTGPSLTAPALLLCDSSGNAVNGVPLHYNQGNFASFSFKGPKFGVWDGFKTDRTQNKSITSKSIAQSASSLYSGLATNYLEVGGDSFFLKPTTAQFCFNVSYCDAIKTPNVLYKISVLARQVKSNSSNVNESLNIGLAKFVSSGVYINGAFETPQTLSESWQVLNFFVTPVFDSLTNIFAYILNRSNNTSDVIEIKEITVDNVFSESYSGASTINVPTRKNRGKNIYVSLSDGTNTASSILNYSNGVLYETSKKASATETLDFSATYANSNIEIVRTGTNSANGAFNVLVED